MNQAEQIELSIQQARAKVELMQAVQRLISNKDFDKVITEGYFKEEASRLVLLKADSAMQSAENQHSIEQDINAIGRFRLYVVNQIKLGEMALRAIQEDEATREELLKEGL